MLDQSQSICYVLLDVQNATKWHLLNISDLNIVDHRNNLWKVLEQLEDLGGGVDNLLRKSHKDANLLVTKVVRI